MRTEQEMLELITEIAKEEERIRAAYIHGSRANPNAEIDMYSDYDVVYVVNEIESFINDKGWIKCFGDIAIVIEAYRNQNNFFMQEINDLSRRFVWSMLFKDGNHIDLMMEVEQEAMTNVHIKNKPIIVLLDKDHCLPEITLPNDADCNIKKPCEKEYIACCSGFWWFLHTVAKGIARDQLPYAKEEFHSYIITTLNRMVEWYIGVQTNFSVSIGRDSRYYKRYLPADIYDLYAKIYSDGNYTNFWKSIFSTCDLYSRIASSVGDYFGFHYNKDEENSMLVYLEKVKNDHSLCQ